MKRMQERHSERDIEKVICNDTGSSEPEKGYAVNIEQKTLTSVEVAQIGMDGDLHGV